MEKAIQKVKDYIIKNNLIYERDRIIVGLSGGADSVCLLCLLKEIKSQIDFNLEAIHIHHGIRGEEADRDEEFSRKLCESLEVPYKAYRRNIPLEAEENHESEEECGRRIRYEIFNQEALKTENSKIAVAHHMDDQAETILFRILRGTGIKGIAGMRAKNGIIIRPLLCLTKEEIISYLKEIGQSYKVDSTNNDTDYSRNYIRNEIIPRFGNINDNSVEHIMALGQEALEIEEYLDEEAGRILEESLVLDKDKQENNRSNKKYRVQNIVNLNSVIKVRIIRKIITDSGISLKDVSREHICQINSILEKSEAGQICLPGKASFIQESGVIFIKKEERKSQEYCINIEGEGYYKIEDIGELKCRIFTDFSMESIPQSPYTKWLDYDKIRNGLCVRNRRSGDFLIINKEGKRKSLKDYMINEKIPKSERDAIPIIAVGDRVCWVIGHRISEDVKVTDKTNRVIEICFVRGESHG